MEIIAKEWRTGQDCTGIVLIRRDDGRFQAYVGPGSQFATERKDAERIVEGGARLSFAEAKGFFPDLKQEEYGAPRQAPDSSVLKELWKRIEDLERRIGPLQNVATAAARAVESVGSQNWDKELRETLKTLHGLEKK